MTAPAPSAGARAAVAARRRTRVAVAGVMANGVAALTLVYFVQPLLPSLARRFAVGAAEASLALSITTFSLVAGLLVVAPLADRLGSARLLRGSLTVATLLAAACALAPDWGTLLALRAALGASLAAPLALPMSMLRPLAPGRYPALAGAYVAATGLGTALARLAPLSVFDVGGWVAVAAGAAGVAAIATILVWIAGFPAAEAPRASSPWRALRRTVDALGDRVIATVCLVSFTSMGAFVGVFNAMGFHLPSIAGGTAGAATLVYALYPLAIAGPFAAAFALHRWGRPRAALLCVGVMLVGVGTAAVPALPVAAVALGVLTFGFLGLNSLTAAWVVERAHVVERPVVGSSSAFLIAYYAGSGALGFLAVQVWSTAGWLATVAVSVALLCGAALAIVLAARGDRGGEGSGGTGTGLSRRRRRALASWNA